MNTTVSVHLPQPRRYPDLDGASRVTIGYNERFNLLEFDCYANGRQVYDVNIFLPDMKEDAMDMLQQLEDALQAAKIRVAALQSGELTRYA